MLRLCFVNRTSLLHERIRIGQSFVSSLPLYNFTYMHICYIIIAGASVAVTDHCSSIEMIE